MVERTAEDRRFEDRLRAHLRQWMERRNLGPTATAKLLEFDQGYVTKWLQAGRGSRGVSALFAFRMTKVFGIDPDQLFNGDPPEAFWRTYVPRAKAGDPASASSSAQPTRPKVPRAAEPTAEFHSRRKGR